MNQSEKPKTGQKALVSFGHPPKPEPPQPPADPDHDPDEYLAPCRVTSWRAVATFRLAEGMNMFADLDDHHDHLCPECGAAGERARKVDNSPDQLTLAHITPGMPAIRYEGHNEFVEA